MEKIKEFKRILQTYGHNLFSVTEGWYPIEEPIFELSHRDYLEFAEDDINGTNIKSRIEVVAHTKRAIEAAIDYFLHVYGIHNAIKKRNLGLETKLSFMEEIGIGPKRSFIQLNKIRNKIEHDFKNPSNDNAELFLDIVSVLCSNIEFACMALAYGAHQEYRIEEKINDQSGKTFGYLEFEYNPHIREFDLNLKLFDEAILWDNLEFPGKDSHFQTITNLKTNFDESYQDYSYFLKAFLALWKLELGFNPKFLIKTLDLN